MKRPAPLLVLVVAMLLSACGGKPSPCLGRVARAPDGRYVLGVERDGPTTHVRYRDGRHFELPADPRRVVSTLPGLTETVAYLGEAKRLVAVSRFADVPGLRDLPRISVMPLSAEKLAELAPDLVLVDAVVKPVDVTAAAGVGVPVLPVESRSLAHWRATVHLLGEVFGTASSRERAARLVGRLEEAERDAAAQVEAGPPLRVLLLAQAEPLYALGPGSLLDDMLRACGAVNVACDLGRASGPFSEELVVDRRPEVILDVEGRPVPPGRLARWARVPAVRAGQVVDLGGNEFVRAGPRTPDALRRLAEILGKARAVLPGRPAEGRR